MSFSPTFYDERGLVGDGAGHVASLTLVGAGVLLEHLGDGHGDTPVANGHLEVSATRDLMALFEPADHRGWFTCGNMRRG